MKAFGFCVLFLLLGTAMMFFCFSSKANTSSSSGTAFTCHENDVTITATPRKLKVHVLERSVGLTSPFDNAQNSYTRSSDKSDAAKGNLDDYSPIDPVPSSTVSIRPGPIEHGTPLIPYIPKPLPPGPGHSNPGGFP